MVDSRLQSISHLSNWVFATVATVKTTESGTKIAFCCPTVPSALRVGQWDSLHFSERHYFTQSWLPRNNATQILVSSRYRKFFAAMVILHGLLDFLPQSNDVITRILFSP